jgi:hypothetical protein
MSQPVLYFWSQRRSYTRIICSIGMSPCFSAEISGGSILFSVGVIIHFEEEHTKCKSLRTVSKSLVRAAPPPDKFHLLFSPRLAAHFARMPCSLVFASFCFALLWLPRNGLSSNS